ncbi:MAG: hypothetical protein A2Y38_00400 [Spirochaetes bacterium GWB1_59_5]|nr:MAG: hypothetical protein A2Y38_00400 [Spirochaetes bacterium GWB1_59_5]
MSVTFEEYMDKVGIIALPMIRVAHPKGGLTLGSTFWLHTAGMEQFGRPELEMVNVPGEFLAAAGHRLNHWAFYSIEKEIKAGQNIREGDTTFHPFLEIVASENTEFWTEVGSTCLRIQLGAVLFECAECGHRPTPATLH